jgi:hypothetical protein
MRKVMTNPSHQQTLEEIFAPLHHSGRNGLCTRIPCNKCEQWDEAKHQISQLFREVLGEDERLATESDINDNDTRWLYNSKVKDVNRIRAKQRERAKALGIDLADN